MRFIVIGAGAVGGVVGGRLHQSGHDVVLIARGDHLSAIQANGLVIESPDDEAAVAVPAVASPTDLDWQPTDVVLLAVKSQDTDRALDDLLAALPADHRPPPVACLQNGVENERRVLRRVPDVYGVHVMLPADHLRPGIVAARSAPVTGALNVGRYPHGVDAVAEDIAAAFSSSMFLAEPIADVMSQKYAKLLMNLGNAVEALCDGDQPFAGSLAKRARDEGRVVLDAAGITVAPRGFDAHQREHFKVLPIKGQPRGGGSTWQSLARGLASVETDYLNGEIVLLGRLHGVPTPVNEALQRLTVQAVHEGRAPGSMTEDELTSAIDRFAAGDPFSLN